MELLVRLRRNEERAAQAAMGLAAGHAALAEDELGQLERARRSQDAAARRRVLEGKSCRGLVSRETMAELRGCIAAARSEAKAGQAMLTAQRSRVRGLLARRKVAQLLLERRLAEARIEHDKREASWAGPFAAEAGGPRDGRTWNAGPGSEGEGAH
jgi:flagellar biosynthesis chaperone FliJ